LRASGETARSNALAAEWTRAHPSDASFPFFMAIQAIADRQYAEAEGELRQVLRVDQDNVMALNNLAWVMSAQKKPQALEYAERANLLAPDRPLLMDTLAQVLADQGQLPRALDTQKKAVQLDPDDHDLRLRLARLYVQLGNKAAARSELDALAKVGNTFARQSEVHEMLQHL
jgi:predicted Zn-dependent protease